MSTYKTGVVKLVGSSNVVIGTGTAFSTYVSAGYLFKRTIETAFYEVAAVSSATRLTLTTNYTGVAAAVEVTGVTYQIVTDYTPNFDLPEMGINDVNFAHIYTKAMRLIDEKLQDLEDRVASLEATP